MMSGGSRRGLRIASAFAGAVAVTSAMVAMTPAESAVPPPLVLNTTDGVVKTQCRFTVTSVNYVAGTLRGRVTLHTRPTSYAAGKTVAHTDATCYLLSPNGVEAQVIASANGPYTYKSRLVSSTPAALTYGLCGGSSWDGKDGVTTGGSFNCAVP